MPARSLSAGGALIEIYTDASELAFAAAGRFAELAGKYVNENGVFTVALSGGSTPRAMYTLLAGEPYSSTVPWRSIHFFWGDERCVAPGHPDSNYRMARETLLSRVPAPPENVHRIPGEIEPPRAAADRYESDIVKALARFDKDYLSAGISVMPRLDLILLGMGADAHTASLFPGTDALRASGRIVVDNYVPKLSAHRITFTADAINNARNVAFIVAGADKAEALRQVIEGERRPEEYPSQMINARAGNLVWMVDEAAARLLTGGDGCL
jgi:6-phosphogluconolactonase